MIVKPTCLKETSFYLAKCRVEPQSNKLISPSNEVVSLRPKVMQVLVCLAENSNQIVERGQLIETVWRGNDLVGGRGITDAIWQLRKIFGSNHSSQHVIETVSRKGYILRLSPTVASSIDQRQCYWKSKYNYFIFSAFLLTLASLYLSKSNDTLMSPLPNFVTPDKIKTLNQAPEEQNFAKLSNNGNWVAFVHASDGFFHLKIQEIENHTNSFVTLDSSNQLIGYPTWSSDDSELAYAIADSQGNCVVRILRMFDKKKKDLTDCNPQYLSGLAWSTDGGKLAVADAHLEEETQVIKQGIALINLQDKSKTILTQTPLGLFNRDLYPLWVNEGNKIVFVRSTGVDNQDIFVVDLQGDVKRLTFFNSVIRGLSPGSHKDSVIFSFVKNKISTLKEINLVNLEVKPLFIADSSAVFPSYSLQQHRLLYSRYSQSKQLASVNFHYPPDMLNEAAKLRVESHDPYVSEHYPSYSTSNNMLAYISNQGGVEQIWIKNLTTNQLEPIFHDKAKVYGVSWSPDGKYVAFTMAKGLSAYKQIHIADIESKQITQITHNETEHAPPTWSEDGKSIFTGELEENDFYLYEYTLSGQKRRLLQPAAIYGFRRGNQLFYSKYLSRGIWQFDLNTKRETRLIEDLAIGDGSNWEISERGVFFLERETKSDKLMFYDFLKKKSKLKYTFETGRISKYENFEFDAINNRLFLVLQPKQKQRIYYVSYP